MQQVLDPVERPNSLDLDHCDRHITVDFASEEPFSNNTLLNGFWLLGTSSWGFGIVNRTFMALADKYLSVVEISQLLAASLIFFSWFFFKPYSEVSKANFNRNFLTLYEGQEIAKLKNQHYFYATLKRMFDLRNYHMIRQEYVFPFPYLCQIYHLLNLKHLEEVHSFSLNNLRIVKVSDFWTTEIGGALKFQTMLESPINTLRIWRQPLVEVNLTLHTPYTVELNVPVYNDKRIIVIFNVLPLSETEHKLYIDIYSNLGWPKPILQAVLHLAACLTVFEDLPYLQKLAERNLEKIIHSRRISNHETMLLFKRFAELYSTNAA
jgi:hypothetical protein